MSGPLILNASDVQRLSDMLAAISAATRQHQIRLDAYGQLDLMVTNQTTVHVRWDVEAEQYVIDDRVGS